jgi:flagellar hook-associated protein 3 FlgL
MRIATSQAQSTMLRSLTGNQNMLTKINEQMASGSRIQVPSDDPLTNVRISRLNREEAIVGQYRNNIDTVTLRLQKNETYLTSVVADIGQVRDMMVFALDGSTRADDLQAMVGPLEALRDSMLYSANVTDQEGRHIFSGTATNLPAITFDASAAVGSRYTFTGNTNQQKVVVGNGINQAVNVNVSGMEAYLNAIDSTLEALKADTTITPNDPAMRAILELNLTGSDDALDLVSGLIADLGGSRNILSTLAGNHGNVSLSNQVAIHDLGALDYSVAASDLNGYTMALQATYKAYTKVSNLSLFNSL